MYDPVWSAENAADETDRKFLSPRACVHCGVVMENGFDDECNECWEYAQIDWFGYDTEEDDEDEIF